MCPKIWLYNQKGGFRYFEALSDELCVPAPPPFVFLHIA